MKIEISETLSRRLTKMAEGRPDIDHDAAQLVEELIYKSLSNSRPLDISDGELLILNSIEGISTAVKSTRSNDDTMLLEGLAAGHSWAVKRKFEWVLHDHYYSDQEYKLTTSILDMFRGLKDATNQMSKEDLDMLDKFDTDWEEATTFSGFDGNNEGAYYSIAQYAIENMGLWKELKRNDYNTHHPTLERYKAMLSKFAVHRAGSNVYPISASSVIDVIAAGKN